ncbi:MAG: hypothetical protein QOG46_926, partial [Pseudonocardiales bacterium]|nr:hypothetical protein [Pseudonocardiales bacterium]
MIEFLELDGSRLSGGRAEGDRLRHVARVRFERFVVRIRSAVEAATQRELGHRFHVPRA